MEFEDFINDYQLKEIANLNKKKLSFKKNINIVFFICLIIWLIPILLFFKLWNLNLPAGIITSNLFALVIILFLTDVTLGTFLLAQFYFGDLLDNDPSNYKRNPEGNYIQEKKYPVLFFDDHKIEEYISECKNKLFRPVLELLIDEFEYKPNQFFNHKEVKDSQLFREFESLNEERKIEIKGGDFISGLFNNNLIEFCELDIKLIIKGNSETSSLKIFHGLFLKADLEKNFKSETFIKARFLGKIKDLFEDALTNFSEDKPKPTKESKKLKNISLQNFLFNKHYIVTGTDEIETRKILSPVVLENLANFAEKHPEDILISLFNNKMYFALKIGSFLSPDLTDLLPSKKLNKNLLKNDLFRIYEEINLIINILNDLRLNSPNKYLS